MFTPAVEFVIGVAVEFVIGVAFEFVATLAGAFALLFAPLFVLGFVLFISMVPPRSGPISPGGRVILFPFLFVTS
jgi:hypothetical protein